MALRFYLRQLSYDLETNLLFRPAIVGGGLLLAGLIFPTVELVLIAEPGGVRALSAWLAPEPATAQLLMATVAGAVMTVVSVVYSILLVALSLASMQFSTRILAGFMRDPLSRSVLGLFVGTFAYCLALVRSISSAPPVVPGIALTVGLTLAAVCLAALVVFIHHIVRSIQANQIVARIAAETEVVLASVFAEVPAPPPPPPCPALPFHLGAASSGYVQLIDEEELLRANPNATIAVLRGTGAFVAAGVPLLASDRELAPGALACIDVGPERTMQQDAEFGFRQIVDIALKALSPAVNDPSTAATCIDHLGRLLLFAAPRAAGPKVRMVQSATLHMPLPTFVDLLDLSVEQIRQYGRGDMATALRLMRVLAELRPNVRTEADVQRLRFHADRIREAAAVAFCAEDNAELERRYSALIAR